MNSTQSLHTFHIPVMGLAFTIDSPIRVAHFGIDSVISITDDELFEKISKKIDGFRARRVRHYLNLVVRIVKEKFESELLNYKKALPEIETPSVELS